MFTLVPKLQFKNSYPTTLGMSLLAAAYFTYGAVATFCLLGPWRGVDALNWGTVGEWAAGIATFFAAAVALNVGLRPELRQERERSARAQLLAWRLQREVVLTRKGLATFKQRATLDRIFKASGNDEVMGRLLRSLGEYGLPTAKAEFEKLTWFPRDLGVRIASCIAPVEIVADTLRRAQTVENGVVRAIGIRQALSTAMMVKPQIDAILESLTAIGNGERDPHAHKD